MLIGATAKNKTYLCVWERYLLRYTILMLSANIGIAIREAEFLTYSDDAFNYPIEVASK